MDEVAENREEPMDCNFTNGETVNESAGVAKTSAITFIILVLVVSCKIKALRMRRQCYKLLGHKFVIFL
tara:strand:- start:205 stop:411 length:207 start_codon:yes stop_codon:yes gene_type:complete